MAVTDEQAELLAALVLAFPDVENTPIVPNRNLPAMSLQLHWDKSKTLRIYNDLKAAAAIKEINNIDFITPAGFAIGAAANNEKLRREIIAAHKKEKSQRRWDLNLVFLGVGLTFCFTLLAIYLGFRFGWGK